MVSNNSEKTLTSILKEKYAFIEPCHRLDRNTTGLVVFAKNEEALAIILDKFKNSEIEKHYKCTVYRIPKRDKETLTAYLFKDTKKSMVYVSPEPKTGYRKIITSYEVLKRNNDNNTSVLDVTLHTGRTHQIRAHLAYICLFLPDTWFALYFALYNSGSRLYQSGYAFGCFRNDSPYSDQFAGSSGVRLYRCLLR